MRGKASFFGIFCPGVRITPAYAGKSPNIHQAKKGQRDHPRVCGEKITLSSKSSFGIGSPPRMRGKANMDCDVLRQVRITPAYAGKSFHDRPVGGRPWDHPRVCGEKGFVADCHIPQCGSPPRMRGKVFRSTLFCKVCGITPAYAGKRALGEGTFVDWWDHPRVCGEKHIDVIASTAQIGSPPRMRGKVCRIRLV